MKTKIHVSTSYSQSQRSKFCERTGQADIDPRSLPEEGEPIILPTNLSIARKPKNSSQSMNGKLEMPQSQNSIVLTNGLKRKRAQSTSVEPNPKKTKPDETEIIVLDGDDADGIIEIDSD